MNRIISNGILAIVVASLAIASIARAEGGGATPEETFELFKADIKEKDFQGAFTHLAPDTQNLMLGGIAMAVSVSSMDPAKAPAANTLLQKHQIKPLGLADLMAAGGNPDAGQKMIVGMVKDVKDKPACFADLLAWMDDNAPKGPDGAATSGLNRIGDAKLTDVKIDGDTAQGQLTTTAGDQEHSQEIKFQKVDDKWLIAFEFPKKGQGGAKQPVPRQ